MLICATVSMLVLSACAAEQSAFDRVLPYWDAPKPSSPTVLTAAKAFDVASQPYPNLSTVPPRPAISATERIASLEPELTSDQMTSDELRANGVRPDLPPPSEIIGLEAYQVDPAPDPPTLVTAPRVDLSAPAIRIPAGNQGAVQEETGLPGRTGAVPAPPPLVETEPALTTDDVIAPPPEPVIAAIAVPEPITTAPPEFTVAPIEEQAAFEPPPVFEPAPMIAPVPAFEPPPALDIAALGPPVTELVKNADIDAILLGFANDGTLSDKARNTLDALIADTRSAPSGRLRLVGYGDADAVTADAALGLVRQVADYLQDNGIARGRLILAPPEILNGDPRIGSVAVFALP